MPPEEEPAPKDRQVVIATISAAAVVIAAFIGLVGSGHAPWHHSCTGKLAITSPSDDTKVANGGSGIEVKGTACNLHGDQGWLFDHDLSDNSYTEDYNAAPGPVVVHDGPWSFEDEPVGNPGDSDTPYIITLVDASQACGASLAAEGQSNNSVFETLPAGCIIADSVEVYVESYGK